MFFFFNDTATTEIYTLSLHDALPILQQPPRSGRRGVRRRTPTSAAEAWQGRTVPGGSPIDLVADATPTQLVALRRPDRLACSLLVLATVVSNTSLLLQRLRAGAANG